MNTFSFNQSHYDLSSMPSSLRPMRCEERGVDRFECPSVSVLYHYPSLKIDRSYLKKEIRCHAFNVLGWALSPLSSGRVSCGFCLHYIRVQPQMNCLIISEIKSLFYNHSFIRFMCHSHFRPKSTCSLRILPNCAKNWEATLKYPHFH